MLEFDPAQRINFSSLIDKLSPLLMKNLAEIQKLFQRSEVSGLSQNKEGAEAYANQLVLKLS